MTDKVTVDGENLGSQSKYTFSNVNSNHTIFVEFAKKTSKIPGYSMLSLLIISFAFVGITIFNAKKQKKHI
ncbi:MAG: hypothetical protein ACTSUI_05605 [Promethearchaeota archaeon]